MGIWQQYRSFYRSRRQNPTAVGAVLPSSRQLARAMTVPMRAAGDRALRVLEVGPGTGIVTQEIVRHLPAAGVLDVVELEAEFVRLLEHRFEAEDAFQKARDRCAVHHMSLQAFAAQCAGANGRGPTKAEMSSDDTTPGNESNDAPSAYDVIISSLPLSNFEPAAVAEIFDIFRTLLKPGGTLSYFEYMYIRRLRRILSLGKRRRRFTQLDQALTAPWCHNQYHRDRVWLNVPPAWVHHLTFDA